MKSYQHLRFLILPFGLVGTALAAWSCYIFVDDLANPSKMSPLGAYLGFAGFIVASVLVFSSFLICNVFRAKLKTAMIIQTTILAIIVGSIYIFWITR